MSGRHYKAKHVPTDRDVKIMEEAGKVGLITLTQIYKRHFAGSDREGRSARKAYQRMNEMVESGYLHTDTFTLNGRQERFYWIERKAGKLFPHKERVKLVRERPSQSELRHMALAGEVIDKLKRDPGFLGFRTERQLKSENLHIKNPSFRKEKVADIEPLFSVGGEDVSVPIEVDSLYTGVKLQRELGKLSRSYEKALVICFSRSRFHTVAGASKGYSNLEVRFIEELGSGQI